MKITSLLGLMALASVSMADVQSLSFDLLSIRSGSTSVTTATVSLDSPAPMGGTDVFISDDSGGELNYTSTVHVDEGELSAQFPINAPTLLAADDTYTVQATDGIQAVPADASLLVKRMYVKAINIVGASSFVDGTFDTITVSLPSRTLANMDIDLAATGTGVSFPAGTTITMPAGEKDLDVIVQVDAGATSGTVSATIQANSVNFTTGTISVVPLKIVSLLFDNSTVTGGNSTNCTVLLNGKPQSNTNVTLFCGSAFVTVPGSCTVTANTDSVAFVVNTTTVTSVKHTTVRGTLAGVNKQSEQLTINP